MIEAIKDFIEGFLDNWVIYVFAIMIPLAFISLLYSSAKERIKSPTKVYCPINIEHNGHKYIIFTRSREIGAVHDPDCWCNQ